MTFHIITIFPEAFASYFQVGILSRAIKEEKINLEVYDLREFTKNKHRKVDDEPYGGGPGMVMSVEPIHNCITHIKKKLEKEKINQENIKTILFSAKGDEYNQQKARDFCGYDHLIMICGRYEGVDERVAQHLIDEEVSIGEYVLSGGELPAMIVVDSVSRLLPGVLGNINSLESESHSEEKGLVDYPVYTRPEDFQGWKVPEVLLEGNHAKIEEWRKKKQKGEATKK